MPAPASIRRFHLTPDRLVLLLLLAECRLRLPIAESHYPGTISHRHASKFVPAGVLANPVVR